MGSSTSVPDTLGRTSIRGTVVEWPMREFTLRADDTGTIELVCEREDEEASPPRVRSFAGRDEFGLLVEDLTPGEQVLLFVDDTASEE